jgi:hypothetical protein
MLCLPLRQARLDIGEIGADRLQEGADRRLEGAMLGAAPAMLEGVAIAGRSAAAALRRRSGLDGLGNGIVPFVRRSGRLGPPFARCSGRRNRIVPFVCRGGCWGSPLPRRCPRCGEIDRPAFGKSSLPIGNPRQDLSALGRARGQRLSAVASVLDGIAIAPRRACPPLRPLVRVRRIGRPVRLIRISRFAHGQHYTPAARPV